jgi:hypothetical protein
MSPTRTNGSQVVHIYLLLFNIVLEFLTRTITQEQEIKGIQIRKEKVKQSVFADDMILYVKDQQVLRNHN